MKKMRNKKLTLYQGLTISRGINAGDAPLIGHRGICGPP
jgi:hypothetical protein